MKFYPSVMCKVKFCNDSNPYCAVQIFREQRVDGKILVLLTVEHLMKSLGMKLGPAVLLTERVAKILQESTRTSGCDMCKRLASMVPAVHSVGYWRSIGISLGYFWQKWIAWLLQCWGNSWAYYIWHTGPPTKVPASHLNLSYSWYFQRVVVLAIGIAMIH